MIKLKSKPSSKDQPLQLKQGKSVLMRNIASLGLVQLANYVLPLLSVPIISRIIGPEKFGVINFAASFVTYFTLLIGYGFDLSATRKIAANPFDVSNRNKVFSEVFYCQLMLVGVCLIVFPICLWKVDALRSEYRVALYSFLIIVSTLFTQTWLFQAMQELSKVAILNFTSKLLFTVLIILIVTKRQDYFWYPLVLNLINIAISLISFGWGIRRYRLKFVSIPVKELFRLYWTEKMVFFSLVVISLYTTTNIVILGIYRNATQVAYYTSAQKLISIAQSLLTLPLYQALYPFIGKAFGESREKGITIVQKTTPLILCFTGLACSAIFLVGPLFFTLFYGKAFAPGIPVLRILAFIPMIVAMNNLFGIQVMLNMKMDKQFFYIISIGALFSVGFNLLTLPILGYLGSALSWLITEVIINISALIILRSKGINPVNLAYFKWSAIREMLEPVLLKLGGKFHKFKFIRS